MFHAVGDEMGLGSLSSKLLNYSERLYLTQIKFAVNRCRGPSWQDCKKGKLEPLSHWD